jgi:TM2 domain-containing membrane protein YozV
MTEKLKNPQLAMYLGIIPGFGQFYCHQWIKGLLVFVLSLSLAMFVIGLFPWVWGMYDARTQAELWNKRALLKTIEKSRK